MLECLVNGVLPGEKYPKSVREFCFKLSYHSPAAYEVVREQFNNNLPHSKTLKVWLAQSDINAEPGITQGTLKRLKAFVDDLKDEPLICALIFDEMYIMKQMYFDANKLDYVGCITYPEKTMDDEGNEIPLEKLPIARKTIIFMLSGMNKRFQFPFAYHFVDALKANYLAELVTDVIIQVSKCGVKISNLTFDGAKQMLQCAESLAQT